MSIWSNLVGDGFMPHGHCYQWRPELVWLHAGSDAVVFLCYLTIPVAMLFIAQRRTPLVSNDLWFSDKGVKVDLDLVEKICEPLAWLQEKTKEN